METLADLENKAMFKEPIRYARNEATIFLEYLYKDIGYNRQISRATRDLQEYFNNTWVDDTLIAPYFGVTLKPKLAGFNLFWYIIFPLGLIALYILLKILGCFCRHCLCKICCCCCSK